MDRGTKPAAVRLYEERSQQVTMGLENKSRVMEESILISKKKEVKEDCTKVQQNFEDDHVLFFSKVGKFLHKIREIKEAASLHLQGKLYYYNFSICSIKIP